MTASADLLVALGLVEAGADQLARARALAMARAPVPVGLRAIHPTWIEAGLAGLPERARSAVASAGGAVANVGRAVANAGGAATNPVDVWLARSATAHLPSMIVAPALAALVAAHPAFGLVDGIPTAPPTAVVAWLDGIGADQLAFATGQPLVRLGDAPARIQRAPRKGQLGSQRAAIARCTGVAMDELAHVRIGARTVAPRLAVLGEWAGAVAALQLAVRLPRPVGLVVHRELVECVVATGVTGAAGVAVDAPTWAALLA